MKLICFIFIFLLYTFSFLIFLCFKVVYVCVCVCVRAHAMLGNVVSGQLWDDLAAAHAQIPTTIRNCAKSTATARYIIPQYSVCSVHVYFCVCGYLTSALSGWGMSIDEGPMPLHVLNYVVG